jgi:hypothetical protein
MSVHVDLVLKDDTAAVLARAAAERGVDLATAVAELAEDRARRIAEQHAVDELLDAAEAERDAAVYAEVLG